MWQVTVWAALGGHQAQVSVHLAVSSCMTLESFLSLSAPSCLKCDHVFLTVLLQGLRKEEAHTYNPSYLGD
jgi:hypothetical protein